MKKTGEHIRKMNNEEQQTIQEYRTLEKVKRELDNNSKDLFKLLNELKPNPSSNCFPDFVMPDGFLEHFLSYFFF